MGNYRYELGGIIRDLKCDIPYPTDEIVDLLEEKDQRIKELEEENQQLKQTQKQLAIIKLKLIIYFMENSNNNHYPLPYEIKNFIKNQIKDLEGIKNE